MAVDDSTANQNGWNTAWASPVELPTSGSSIGSLVSVAAVKINKEGDDSPSASGSRVVQASYSLGGDGAFPLAR